jgi:hypothetical protein
MILTFPLNTEDIMTQIILSKKRREKDEKNILDPVCGVIGKHHAS